MSDQLDRCAIALSEEVVMKVTGSCHCGQITYEAEVDPAVRVCHCTDCQKLTGTVWRAGISSLPGTFRLISGAPKVTSRPLRVGINAPTPSVRNAVRRSTRPHLSRTHPSTDCGLVGWINAETLPHQHDSNGADRRCPGQWICARSSGWSGNNGSKGRIWRSITLI